MPQVYGVLVLIAMQHGRTAVLLAGARNNQARSVASQFSSKAMERRQHSGAEEGCGSERFHEGALDRSFGDFMNLFRTMARAQIFWNLEQEGSPLQQSSGFRTSTSCLAAVYEFGALEIPMKAYTHVSKLKTV